MKEDLKQSDREKAFQIIYNVIYEDAFSNLLLKKTDFDSRAFATDLVYGVIERKITFDEIIKELSNINFKKIDKKVIILIYMGLYHLIYSNVKDYAAIYEVVEIAKKYLNKGAAGFINGILRTVQRDNSVVDRVYSKGWEYEYSINTELLNMIKESKLDTESILKYNFYTPKVHLYVRKNLYDIDRVLKSNNILYDKKDDFIFVKNYDHRVLESFFIRGEYSIMDYSTSIIRDIMPNDVKTIFDVCAAPGGKTLLMADKFPNAKIKSSDINKTRVELINNNIKRWGLNNVSTSVNDARIFDGNLYDLVLCDVLCSGSGVISRKPELKYKINYNMVEELNEKQYEIIKNAVNQTRKGGYIIYSTCSILKRENQDIVNKAIKYFNLEKITEELIVPNKFNEGFYACLLKKI